MRCLVLVFALLAALGVTAAVAVQLMTVPAHADCPHRLQLKEMLMRHFALALAMLAGLGGAAVTVQLITTPAHADCSGNQNC
jgi:hypothetical protein